jgi:hypothetical protein
MGERCPDCERLTGEWTEPSDDDACYARTGYDQDKLDCARLTAGTLRAKLTKLEALEADFKLWGLCRECGCKPRECQSARVKCCPDCTHSAADIEKEGKDG